MKIHVDPRRFLRRSALLCGALGLVGSIVASLLWSPLHGASVLVGAAVGWANLWSLSWILQRMVARIEEHRETRHGFSLALLAKWPALFGILALILVFTPVDPASLAAGIVLSLCGGSIAALERRMASNEPNATKSDL